MREIKLKTYTRYSLVADEQQKKVLCVLNVVLELTLDTYGLQKKSKKGFRCFYYIVILKLTLDIHE